MSVAGVFLMLHPPNLVRIHLTPSFKNAESLFMISQLAEDLAKISVSLPSISRGVLALIYHLKVHSVIITLYGTNEKESPIVSSNFSPFGVTIPKGFFDI